MADNGNGNGGAIWKWLTVTLAGIVISGASFVVGYSRVDSRVASLELSIVRIEGQLLAQSERQARDRSDTLERLTRIEGQVDKVVTYITSNALSGRTK